MTVSSSSRNGGRNGSEDSAITRRSLVVGMQGKNSEVLTRTLADRISSGFGACGERVSTTEGSPSSTPSSYRGPWCGKVHARPDIALTVAAPGTDSQEDTETYPDDLRSDKRVTSATTLLPVPSFDLLEDLFLWPFRFGSFAAGAAVPSACTNLHLSPNRHVPLFFHCVH